MDIQINPVADVDSTKHNAIRKKQQRDPLFLLIARTLICIVAIDSLIWGYFAFVKKVSLVEGLNGWTTGIQRLVGFEDTKSPKIIKKTVIVNKYSLPPKEKVVRATRSQRLASLPPRYLNTDDEIHDIEVKNKFIGDGNAVMYSWRDENGRINYSNTGFPEGNIEKLWVRRMLTN